MIANLWTSGTKIALLHDNAPAHLLRLKPIPYADQAQLGSVHEVSTTS